MVVSAKQMKKIATLVALPLIMLSLSGCDLALFDTKGPVGDGIGSTMLYTVLLMLIVVIPTVILSMVVPFKFSEKKNAKYDPEWHHSTLIEAIVWGIPIVIILFLAIETYKTSHSLDPHKELVSVENPNERPLKIQVVALDWKWLFIYPEEGIATVNEIAIPTNKPVQFLLTSDGAINSFFIPRLGGQLYAMAGMENKLNLMATHAGTYKGLSSNYSGYGFSGMRFEVHAQDKAGYEAWVAKVKASSKSLDDETYNKLTCKSRDNKVEYFNNPDPLRFKNIINDAIAFNQLPKKSEHGHGEHAKHDANQPGSKNNYKLTKCPEKAHGNNHGDEAHGKHDDKHHGHEEHEHEHDEAHAH